MNGIIPRPSRSQRFLNSASSALYGFQHRAEIDRIIRDYGLRSDKPETIAAVKAFLQGKRLSVEHLKYLVVGSAHESPVFDIRTGKQTGFRRSIEVNRAATKYTTVPVLDYIHFLETRRASPSRGSGHKAAEMAQAFTEARSIVGEFLGSTEQDVTIFRSNTTNGINLLIRQIMSTQPNANFVLSIMAHHSNQLAARLSGPFEFFNLDLAGGYDLDSLEDHARIASSRGDAVICVESQSNLTGYKNRIDEVAEIARRHNAILLVDHAQGACDMSLRMTQLDSLERFCAAVSGHKIPGGPLATGGIRSTRNIFNGNSCSIDPGGGGVSAVSQSEIHFLEAPAKVETGTQSFIPHMGFAMACRQMLEAGIENVAQQEEILLRSFWPRLLSVVGLKVLGSEDIDTYPRGPVVSFRLFAEDGNPIPPGFIGYCLQLMGVELRVGQYCAHPYSYFLAGASERQILEHVLLHKRFMKAGCFALEGDETLHSTRFSWGFDTPLEDLLALPDMLKEIRTLWTLRDQFFDFDKEKREFSLKGNNTSVSAGNLSPHVNGPRRSYR